MKNEKLFYSILITVSIIVFVLGVLIGSTNIDLKTILLSILSYDNSVDSIIVMRLRIPRTIITLCVGGSLALSGSIVQSIFKNSMADPYIIGVSSGASLGAVVAMITGFSQVFFLVTPIFAFIFAIGTTVLVYSISQKNGVSSTETLILSGIAISSLLGSIINFLIYSTMDEFQASKEILFWLMGSFEGKTTSHMLIILPVTIISFIITLRLRRALDLISLGDTQALILGVNVEKIKKTLIIIATVLTSVSVSISGMIGFVGLIIPHISRLIVGSNHKNLIPTSFLLGGIFLTLIDLIIRVIGAYISIRIGVLTSLIGSPFFIYLLIKNKKKSYLGGL